MEKEKVDSGRRLAVSSTDVNMYQIDFTVSPISIFLFFL